MAKKAKKMKMWLGRRKFDNDYMIMDEREGEFHWNPEWGFSYSKNHEDSMWGAMQICAKYFHKLFPIKMRPGQKPILVEVSIEAIKPKKKKK